MDLPPSRAVPHACHLGNCSGMVVGGGVVTDQLDLLGWLRGVARRTGTVSLLLDLATQYDCLQNDLYNQVGKQT
jgi:hypothetical protein